MPVHLGSMGESIKTVIRENARTMRPGDVYVLRVESVDALRSVDMHMAVPARVLELAQALGALPREVYMVGCEPASVDDLLLELSAPVQKAVDSALRDVQTLLQRPAQ